MQSTAFTTLTSPFAVMPPLMISSTLSRETGAHSPTPPPPPPPPSVAASQYLPINLKCPATDTASLVACFSSHSSRAYIPCLYLLNKIDQISVEVRQTFVHVCVHACVQVCVCTCVRACMRVCACMCVCVCVHTCVCACMRACVYVCMRARMPN